MEDTMTKVGRIKFPEKEHCTKARGTTTHEKRSISLNLDNDLLKLICYMRRASITVYLAKVASEGSTTFRTQWHEGHKRFPRGEGRVESLGSRLDPALPHP